jgi:hypothetical protein
MAFSEHGQAIVRELCDALEETFNTLTQMTDRAKSDDLLPTPLPSNKKTLEFTRAVLKHSFTPSKITDLVKGLREMRSDVQMCFTKLDNTFQHVHTLYNIMGNGLPRISSRKSRTSSIFSTSTNLTVRIELAAWLSRWEETWGFSLQRKPTSVSHAVSCRAISSYFWLQLRGFLQSKYVTAAGTSHMPDDPPRKHWPLIESAADALINVPPDPTTDDLLGKILHYLCKTGPLSLRHWLFVSRRFYKAAMNNAHLWTTISLDSSFFYHFHQWPEQGNAFVEQCLLRSGSLPLCLNIDYSDLIAYDPSFLLQPLGTFGNPKWRGSRRLTSLIWADGGYGATAIQKIVEFLPKSLPSLQYISLSFFDDPMDGSQFPNCPVLERVEILTHRQSHPPFWGTNFAHVTTLSFGNYAGWADYDMATLSQFPVLHDLTLFTEHGRTAPRGVGSHLPISFKHLRILRAHGHIPPEVLIKLVAPALEELHLKSNTEHFTSIDSLQNSFNPFCWYIYALLPKAVSAKEPEWATNLSKLVQKCTRIKSLYLSKWMEEECKNILSDHKVVFHA